MSDHSNAPNSESPFADTEIVGRVVRSWLDPSVWVPIPVDADDNLFLWAGGLRAARARVVEYLAPLDEGWFWWRENEDTWWLIEPHNPAGSGRSGDTS